MVWLLLGFIVLGQAIAYRFVYLPMTERIAKYKTAPTHPGVIVDAKRGHIERGTEYFDITVDVHGERRVARAVRGYDWRSRKLHVGDACKVIIDDRPGELVAVLRSSDDVAAYWRGQEMLARFLPAMSFIGATIAIGIIWFVVRPQLP